MHLGMRICISVRSGRVISNFFHFFRKELLCPWLGPPLRWSGSGCGLNNLFKDSSPLRERTKFDIKIRHNVKLTLWWKHALWRHMCIIASEGLSSLIALLLSVSVMTDHGIVSPCSTSSRVRTSSAWSLLKCTAAWYTGCWVYKTVYHSFLSCSCPPTALSVSHTRGSSSIGRVLWIGE